MNQVHEVSSVLRIWVPWSVYTLLCLIGDLDASASRFPLSLVPRCSLQPASTASAEQDKVVVIFYALVTPMMNPLIYSLRNKDVKAAFRRVQSRPLTTGVKIQQDPPARVPLRTTKA